MEFLLILILLIISLGCFGDAKDVSQKGARLGLSLILVFYLPFALLIMMESIAFMGMLYWIFYFIVPSVGFFWFQLILYDIHLFDE